jgi:hypothetical protein
MIGRVAGVCRKGIIGLAGGDFLETSPIVDADKNALANHATTTTIKGDTHHSILLLGGRADQAGNMETHVSEARATTYR